MFPVVLYVDFKHFVQRILGKVVTQPPLNYILNNVLLLFYFRMNILAK